MLLAIIENRCLGYYISDQPIDSLVYYQFLKDVIKEINPENIENTIIVQDNFKAHKNQLMYSLYK